MATDADEADAGGFAWLAAHDAANFRGAAERADDAALRRVLVVPDTASFRHLARQAVTKRDVVVEIGSSLGSCTKLLHDRAAEAVGFDVSLEQLRASREKYPEVRFEFLDVFTESERLRGMPIAQACTVAFVDINGDRMLGQVLHCIRLLRGGCLPQLRLVAVKSEQLDAAMRAWPHQLAVRGVGEALRRPDDFLAQFPGTESLVQTVSSAGAVAERYPRHELEAAVKTERGFVRWAFRCLAVPETALSCGLLAEHSQPFLRRRAVLCVSGDAAAAAECLEAGRHAFPVFLGSGAFGAPYDFLGSFRAVAILPDDDPLHVDDALVAAKRYTAQRSRKAPPPVWLLRLEAAGDVGGPAHPLQASSPEAWAEEVARRRRRLPSAAPAAAASP